MKQNLKSLGKRIVYIKPIDARDLPDSVREEAEGIETVFAIHNTAGEQVGYVADPAMAEAIAQQNALELVQLH